MVRPNDTGEDYFRPVRRILLGGLILCLLAFFLLWRIDNPRTERFRAQVVDKILPAFDWILVPAAQTAGMLENFQSYSRLYQQNQELQRELQQMRAWKETAQQLEQQNAKLKHLNNVQLDPKLTFVTGVVLADSGFPFRQSVLLNVGQQDGIVDGWAATDGLGLVGRISGVGSRTSRVILLNDSNSRIPVTIQPSGERAILSGDNSRLPLVRFVENPESVKHGDRVISSGDGGVFPADIPVGHVVRGADEHLRVKLSADYNGLDFLRVLRSHARPPVSDAGGLIVPAPAPGASVLADSQATDG